MSETQISKYAGRGQETVQTSQNVPFLRVLQSTSVEIDPSKKGHDLKKIDGAKVGDLFCTGLNILPQPVEVVPVKFMHFYEEQIGSGNNVRIVGQHPIEIQRSPAYSREEVTKNGKKSYQECLEVSTTDSNGRVIKVKNRLAMTILMGVVLPAYNNAPAIIKFQSTSLSKAREIQTAISRYRYPNDAYTLPPTFARSFSIKTVAESNNQGGWMGMQFSICRVLSESADAKLMETANSLVDHNLLLRAEHESDKDSKPEQATPEPSTSKPERPF